VSSAVKQILCIKWGTGYGADYVNRLYGMVSRNVTPPFRFICFTDDRAGIRPEVECFDLPELGCPVPTDVPGKWRKTALWGDELFGLSGTALFLDLDVVIMGSLDPFFEIGNPDDVFLARNWIRPLERLGQTSIFRFPIGKNSYMLEDFRKDSQAIAGKYRFEQRYVTRHVRGGVKFFPSRYVSHFRQSCSGPWILRYFMAPRRPRKARIVIFPGWPNPEDALIGRMNPSMTPMSPFAHLRELFSKDRRRRFYPHLKNYIRPTPWIAEYWRE